MRCQLATYPVVEVGVAREPFVHFRVVDVVSVDAKQPAVGQAFSRSIPVVSRRDDSKRELYGGRARRYHVEHHARRYLSNQHHHRLHRVHYSESTRPLYRLADARSGSALDIIA